MDTKAMPLSSPAQWIAGRRRVADDAIVAYMCHYAAAATATVCGIAADDAWDRAQAVFDTAVTASHAAHPYTIAAEIGATTAADYLQENSMPIAPTSPIPIAAARPRSRTVAVVAYTRARAEQIADALGIDKRWAFGANMADAFDGIHVDRVLIDAHSTALISQVFMDVIRRNVVKSRGSISYVTVRDAS